MTDWLYVILYVHLIPVSYILHWYSLSSFNVASSIGKKHNPTDVKQAKCTDSYIHTTEVVFHNAVPYCAAHPVDGNMVKPE